MDKKKAIKFWLIDKVNLINYKYSTKGHDGFKFEVNSRMAYLFFDKAIPKRILKWLKKKYNINAESWICYEQLGSCSIYVKIIKKEVLNVSR